MSNDSKTLNESIQLTERAANRVKAILSSEKKDGFALRVAVTDGGCSGMNYNISFDDKQLEFDQKVIDEVISFSDEIQLLVNMFPVRDKYGEVCRAIVILRPIHDKSNSKKNKSKNKKRLSES